MAPVLRGTQWEHYQMNAPNTFKPHGAAAQNFDPLKPVPIGLLLGFDMSDHGKSNAEFAAHVHAPKICIEIDPKTLAHAFHGALMQGQQANGEKGGPVDVSIGTVPFHADIYHQPSATLQTGSIIGFRYKFDTPHAAIDVGAHEKVYVTLSLTDPTRTDTITVFPQVDNK